MKWDDLDYWQSKHWQQAQEKLDELDGSGIKYCPTRERLFGALDATDFDATKVAFIGQDPYPNPIHATGLAFSVPRHLKEFPPTLRNIFSELVSDLHIDYPVTGDLAKWTKQGVLLWNSFPTCQAYKSASHRWPEWVELTLEIVLKLDQRTDPVVFVFLGKIAQEFESYVQDSDSICVSHPSPLGCKYGFLGSRLFSFINGKLSESGHVPIDWRL